MTPTTPRTAASTPRTVASIVDEYTRPDLFPNSVRERRQAAGNVAAVVVTLAAAVALAAAGGLLDGHGYFWLSSACHVAAFLTGCSVFVR